MSDGPVPVEVCRVYATRDGNGTYSYLTMCAPFLSWLNPDQVSAMLHCGAKALKEAATEAGPMPGANGASVVRLVPDAPRD